MSIFLNPVFAVATVLLFVQPTWAGEIDRDTFSVSVPEGWSEDKEDDMYDPNGFVFLENEESCLVGIVVSPKSSGLSAAEILLKQEISWAKRFTRARREEFGRWATYKGKGVQLEGDFQGGLRCRVRIFAFESERHVCVVAEFGEIGDLEKFKADFEKIRSTFKLK